MFFLPSFFLFALVSQASMKIISATACAQLTSEARGEPRPLTRLRVRKRKKFGTRLPTRRDWKANLKEPRKNGKGRAREKSERCPSIRKYDTSPFEFYARFSSLLSIFTIQSSERDRAFLLFARRISPRNARRRSISAPRVNSIRPYNLGRGSFFLVSSARVGRRSRQNVRPIIPPDD